MLPVPEVCAQEIFPGVGIRAQRSVLLHGDLRFLPVSAFCETIYVTQTPSDPSQAFVRSGAATTPFPLVSFSIYPEPTPDFNEELSHA